MADGSDNKNTLKLLANMPIFAEQKVLETYEKDPLMAAYYAGQRVALLELSNALFIAPLVQCKDDNQILILLKGIIFLQYGDNIVTESDTEMLHELLNRAIGCHNSSSGIEFMKEN